MIAERLLLAARQAGVTIATAESLTGGGVAAAITAIPGAAEVLLGSVVAYDPSVKIKLLGLDPTWVDEHGVVNAETAVQMARGVLELLEVDFAVSTTGVAGPDPLDGAEVGEVWIGLARRTANRVETEAVRRHFDGDRDEIRRQSVDTAVEALTNLVDQH